MDDNEKCCGTCKSEVGGFCHYISKVKVDLPSWVYQIDTDVEYDDGKDCKCWVNAHTE